MSSKCLNFTIKIDKKELLKLGAATAFGLACLLPLNVPSKMPLMYCDEDTELKQAQISINNQTLYDCVNGTIEVSCLNNFEDAANEKHCLNKTMECYFNDVDQPTETVYCFDGTLISSTHIFCNSSTSLNETTANETTTILNCFFGQLPEHQAAFIPTTTWRPTTAITSEKPFSFGATVHMFILNLIGKGDAMQKPKDSWIPEELTTTTATTTTETPFRWMREVAKFNENGEVIWTLEEVPQKSLEEVKTLNPKSMPSIWIKVYDKERVS